MRNLVVLGNLFSLKKTVLVASAVTLAACGGGGGGGDSAPGPAPGGTATNVTINGTAAKGYINGGKIQVRALDAAGLPIDKLVAAEVTTNATGQFSVTVSSDVRAVEVKLTGGSYADEATGKTIQLQAGESLVAYVYLPTSGGAQVNLTPLTTLAAAKARYLLKTSGIKVEQAISAATTEVTAAFAIGNNFNVVTEQVIPVDNIKAPLPPQSQINYTLLLAGFSALDAADSQKDALQIVADWVADYEENGILGDKAGIHTPAELVEAANNFATSKALGVQVTTSNVFNVPPVVSSISLQVAEDKSLVVLKQDLLAKVSDPNQDNVSLVSIAEKTANGTALSIDQTTGAITYAPAANFNGSDSFTFVVSDSNSATAIGTVGITVTPENDAPVAQDSVLTTAESTSTQATTLKGQLLATDADNDTLTYTVVQQPDAKAGQVTLDSEATGAFTFTPILNFNGTATFTFTVKDAANVVSNTATVTVNVLPVDTTPVAESQPINVFMNKPFNGQLIAVDGDGQGDIKLYAIKTAPQKGAIANLDSAKGTFTYTPSTDVLGLDSFTFQVTDAAGHVSNEALVTIMILDANGAPVANDDLVAVDEDTTLTLSNADLVGNDNDPENDSLVVVSVTAATAQGGTAQLVVDSQGARTIQYTPKAQFNGDDSFSYTVSDRVTGVGKTSTAMVKVTVKPVNDSPVAAIDQKTVAEDTALQIPVADLLVNDSDIDGDTLSVAAANAIDGTTQGTVSLSNGQVTFMPAANFNGTTSFSYTLEDPSHLTATGTVNVTVTPVNDAPVAQTVDVVVAAGETTTGRLAGFDVDGDTLTYSITKNAAGVLTLVNPATGEFTYKPSAAVTATDTFDYSVDDGQKTASGSINITVDALNSANDPILVVAAHPDDEALFAGGVIAAAVARGQPVKVVVVTNGDNGGGGAAFGKKREKESIEGLNVLGVKPNDILFLGYPDDQPAQESQSGAGLRGIYSNHLGTDPYVSKSTQLSATYGDQGLGLRDFHSYLTGQAGAYTKANLLGDLEEVVKRYQPRKIYTHSFADDHPDHRMVYQFVLDAVAATRRSDNLYRPDIYTAIVHSPAGYPYFNTVSVGGKIVTVGDKWLETQFPMLKNLDTADDPVWPAPAFVGTLHNVPDMIKRFTPNRLLDEPTSLHRTPLQWENHLSIFVPSDMQVSDNAMNAKFRAIDKYTSQAKYSGLIYAFGKADEAFWQGPSARNIAAAATIQASSENVSTRQLAVNVADGIVDGYLPDPTGVKFALGNFQAEWATAGAVTTSPTLTFTWNKSYTISEVRLFDRPLVEKQVKGATLTFSDGTTKTVGALPNDGLTPGVVTLSPPVVANSLTITIDSYTDTAQTKGNWGLSEVEIIAVVNAGQNHRPFFVQGPTVDGNQYTVAPGASVTIHAPARDKDGDTITYAWAAQKGTITGAGADVTYTAPAAPMTTDVVTVTITDGASDPVKASFTLFQ